MVRYRDLTEEQLLQLEDEWMEKEDSLLKLNKGIQLYESLSRRNPNEIRYKEMLVRLLLEQGEEEKMRQHAFNKARISFLQLIRLEKDHAIAHYRLGFLYFYEKNWTESINAFQKALESNPTLKRKMLNAEQRVKAHHYILKATQILALNTLEKINHLPEKELQLFAEIKLLKEEMEAGLKGEKPYLMIVNGTEKSYISEREYEELSEPNVSSIILDQGRTGGALFSVFNNDIQITDRQVPLLEMIMSNPGGVSNDQLINSLYYNATDGEATLRQNIRRLRERIRQKFPFEEFIITLNGKYRWNNQFEYRIFKHSRDVTHDLLLN